MSTQHADLLRELQMYLVNQVMANERMARRFGLSLAELQLLHLLTLRPDLDTARALVATTGLPTSTVGDMLDRIERAGFVSRERSRENRRLVLISVTPQIRRIAEEYVDSGMSERMADTLADFSTGEVDVLIRYFRGINEQAAER